MKINIGDYVRSKNGYIGKYLQDYYGDENGAYYDDEKDLIEILIDEEDGIESISVERKDDIIKTSPNIINLVFKDDFVNGSKVIIINIDKEKDTWSIVLENEKILIGEHVNSFKPIKSIMTK